MIIVYNSMPSAPHKPPRSPAKWNTPPLQEMRLDDFSPLSQTGQFFLPSGFGTISGFLQAEDGKGSRKHKNRVRFEGHKGAGNRLAGFFR